MIGYCIVFDILAPPPVKKQFNSSGMDYKIALMSKIELCYEIYKINDFSRETSVSGLSRF